MFHPNVPHHQHKRHTLPVLLTLHPSLLLILLGRSLYLHTLPIRHFRMGPCRLAWVADHADYLPDIGTQAQPAKQADQGGKCALEISWFQRCNHYIFHIEEGIMRIKLHQ